MANVTNTHSLVRIIIYEIATMYEIKAYIFQHTARANHHDVTDAKKLIEQTMSKYAPSYTEFNVTVADDATSGLFNFAITVAFKKLANIENIDIFASLLERAIDAASEIDVKHQHKCSFALEAALDSLAANEQRFFYDINTHIFYINTYDEIMLHQNAI